MVRTQQIPVKGTVTEYKCEHKLEFLALWAIAPVNSTACKVRCIHQGRMTSYDL